MRKILGSGAAILLALPAFGARLHGPLSPGAGGRLANVRILTGPPARSRAAAAAPPGLAVNLPVIGKLIGGGVQYYTSVDVSNNTGNSLVVDFYLDGRDQATGQPIPTVAGHIVSLGSSTVLFGRATATFGDFIHDLVQQGVLSPQVEADGILGSMLVVFEGENVAGAGSAQARFYSHSCGGSIGVSARGREITSDNPLALVGIATDTRATPLVPNLYPNIFINNIGYDHAGNPLDSDVTVTLTAWDNVSSGPVGISPSFVIPAFQTIVIGDVLNFLDVPAQDDTILVYLNVTSGSSAIQALAVEVDQITRDGSATEMTNAEND